jgi:hypothetical protein
VAGRGAKRLGLSRKFKCETEDRGQRAEDRDQRTEVGVVGASLATTALGVKKVRSFKPDVASDAPTSSSVQVVSLS